MPSDARAARRSPSWPPTDRLRDYVQERLAGDIERPSGERVPGPEVRFIGRRHGRRTDRRWAKSWSPEQISNRLKVDFPDDETMRISPEAIYQALFIQGRGALKRELVACLRTGRALRVPRARTQARGKKFVTPLVMITERPAEVEDRAVPGHWEGDLIIGLNKSAIGTLVERTTRFTMLLHLPPMDGHGTELRVKNGPPLAGHGAEAVRDEIARVIVDAARAAAPFADLGPRRGDGPTRPAAHRHRAADLLLRSAQPVAARHQREHQRALAPVLPQGDRPPPPQPRRPRRRRLRAEHPAPQDPRLEDTRRSPRRTSTLHPASRCCDHPLSLSNTRRGRSPVELSTRGSCRRWVRSVTVTTTARWSRSGRGCKSSCSTARRWNTRLELANAIFEYLEIFHNRQRRHSSLGMLSPIEYELRHADNTARDQAS